jgi:hypothetical protein
MTHGELASLLAAGGLLVLLLLLIIRAENRSE